MNKKYKSSLKKNIFSLGIAQVIMILIPFFSIPYLVRTMGNETFGKFAFFQAFILYLSIFSDYSFVWQGSRELAANRENNFKLKKIFSSMWGAQFLITAFLLLVSLIIIPNLKIEILNSNTIYPMLLFFIGNFLFPIWFYQGMELIRFYGLIQITGKIISLPLYFIYVNGSEDLFKAEIIHSSAWLISGIISFIYLFNQRKYLLVRVKFSSILYPIKKGFNMFLSRGCTSIYTTLTPIILGSIGGPISLSYFVIADKFRILAQTALNPISNALFPRLSYLYSYNKKQAKKLLINSSIIIIFTSFLASILIWLLAPFLINLLAGDSYLEAVKVLKWLAPIPLIISLSNIFGLQILIPNKYDKQLNITLIIACVLNLLIIFPLVSTNNAVGAAQACLITEFFVSSLLCYFVFKKRKLIFNY